MKKAAAKSNGGKSAKSAAEAAPALECLLSVRLVQLAEIISKGATQVYETRFGVKNTELRILILLGGESALAVNELSRKTRVDKGWISRSLDAMEERGLVSRTEHTTDSRVSLVSLTERGADLLKRIDPVARARNAHMLKGLNEQEVVRILDVLRERAEELLEDCEPEAPAQRTAATARHKFQGDH